MEDVKGFISSVDRYLLGMGQLNYLNKMCINTSYGHCKGDLVMRNLLTDGEAL